MANIGIVGGGPVGALQAMFIAQRGFQVELYESKKDTRNIKLRGGRSINLTLSHRGRAALRAVGCEEDVLKIGTPMYSRYVHLANGKTFIQPYGQELISVNRQHLNELLLTKAEAVPNLKIHFEHKLTRSDFKSKTHVFSIPDNKEINAKFLFTFGCDGAYSTVRRQLQNRDRLDYSQQYIEHGYKELTMPPTENGEYAMPGNYLHIWPRQEYMMIAQPNVNKSFILTLFMPFSVFNSIETEEDLLRFFTDNFSDSVEKIGRQNLVKDYFANPLGKLISVKCSPYYFDNSDVMIMGDAAHAIVPFYAQGLNTGMEDCLVFDEFMSETNNNLQLSAHKYSQRRVKDGHAIADLSMYNYIEMRSLVTSKVFMIQKKIDDLLHWLFPHYFIPLYTMVAFTRIPVHQVVIQNQWQKLMIKCGIWISVLFIALGVAGYRFLIQKTTWTNYMHSFL